MKTLVTKLLGPPLEIGTCSANHHHRWMIFGSEHFKVYLHHSFSDTTLSDASTGDASTDDYPPYPARLISIGLAKSYTRKSGDTVEALADRAAWMLLIAES